MKKKNKEKKTIILTGVFSASGHGYGFVTVEDGDEYYISEKHCKNALHSDTVSIEVIKNARGGKKKEARVLEVLVHAVQNVVGTFDYSGKGFGFVIPDNKKISSDIYIPKEKTNGARSGYKVVCALTDYGSDDRKPEGKIMEILGKMDEPGVDVLSVVKQFELPTAFPEKVINRLRHVPDSVSDADKNMRKDFTDLLTITIDSEDTKDIDDAISLEYDGTYYKLYVHIADVANYVQENSAIDREALKRGTSVYLVDRVIPMLPKKLSNGICSLNEDVDRLTLTCIMTVDENADVVDHEIVESYIRSNHQMTYTDVNAIIAHEDKATMERFKDLVPMLMNMKDLADILRKKRKSRGSIDFDIPESKIILDDNGFPVEIKPYERNLATRLIEEFMLLANETVAQHFFFMNMPFVYRVHEKPEPDKIKKLALFIAGFGYGLKFGSGEIHPRELQQLLLKVDGTNEEALISRLTLRSMQRAKYANVCDGHFGLALRYYCHFTSPIRRYPDLQIHRIIKDCIHGRMNDDKIAHYESILAEVCSKSSTMERIADEAERECDKLKKCQFMESKLGERFTGIISGVTNWGIYVELENTCEGLVHVSKIPGDYYIFDESTYELIGEATGRRFSLGEKIEIVVNYVDMIDRTVDFVLNE